MELVTFAKEMLQTVAEHAASYRLGQSALRHIDRALWVVEKCARWAVPPPLDQDERPQPELVRPLPWVFFLALLVTLRVTRESISLVNLVMGKPPLRSADVVMYIQSKRRYLRTLKYQGNRMMRARATAEPQQSWYARAQSLLEFTMCYRQSQRYGNNNSTSRSNNDEVLVVKRSKPRQSPAGGAESTMDRLIEKMMHDLDAGSDDDSSFTLTNVTSIRSDRSDTESDQDTILHHDASTPCDDTPTADTSLASNYSAFFTPEKNQTIKTEVGENNAEEKQKKAASSEKASVAEKQNSRESTPKQESNKVGEKDVEIKQNKNECSPKQDNDELVNKQRGSETPEKQKTNNVSVSREDAALQSAVINSSRSPKDDTRMLLQSEKSCTQQSPSPNSDRKNANGQIMNSASKRKAHPHTKPTPDQACLTPQGLNSGRRDFNSNNKST